MIWFLFVHVIKCQTYSLEFSAFVYEMYVYHSEGTTMALINNQTLQKTSILCTLYLSNSLLVGRLSLELYSSVSVFTIEELLSVN